MLMKKTLLLVGGDLCTRTAARLDPSEWRCLGLRRTPMTSRVDGVIWHHGDLLRPETLSFLADDPCSQITHILFAPTPDGRAAANYKVYAEGLASLLGKLSPKCLHALERCVMVGSSAVWGPSEDWVDEETPVNGSGFRAEALLDAEEVLQTILPAGRGAVLRLSGLYGPGRVQLLKGLRAGTIRAPEGTGHWANRIHIDDAARACAHLLALPDAHRVYIGTDDTPMPTAELYDAIARAIAAPAPSRRQQEPEGKRLSNARLRASGWTPVWPDARAWYATEGLAELA